jgi:hypothetical protein
MLREGQRVIVCCFMLGLACDTPSTSRPTDVDAAAPALSAAPSATANASKGSLRGARELMEKFLEPAADHAVLLAQLTPKPGDFAVVFTGDFAKRAEPHYGKRFADLSLVPAEGETELLMWKVRSEEFRSGTGDARKCAAAWAKVAASLAPGLTWYCFKLVKPAEKKGTESEGLVFVNGHWALFPAPWDI